MYYSFMVGIGIRLFIPLMLTRNFTNKRVLKNDIYMPIIYLFETCHRTGLPPMSVDPSYGSTQVSC